jgi:hypothetical protein
MISPSVCARTARRLNRQAVQYRQWAIEDAAKNQPDRSRHWWKEARTRFEDAAWWIGRARRLSDG